MSEQSSEPDPGYSAFFFRKVPNSDMPRITFVKHLIHCAPQLGHLPVGGGDQTFGNQGRDG